MAIHEYNGKAENVQKPFANQMLLPIISLPPSQVSTQFWQNTGTLLEQQQILSVTFTPKSVQVVCPSPAIAKKISLLSEEAGIKIEIAVQTPTGIKVTND